MLCDKMAAGRTGQNWMSEAETGGGAALQIYAADPPRHSGPIGYWDGMKPYGYVRGDPVNLRDPSGLMQEPAPPDEDLPPIEVCGGAGWFRGKCISWMTYLSLSGRSGFSIQLDQGYQGGLGFNACQVFGTCNLPDVEPQRDAPRQCSSAADLAGSGRVSYTGQSTGVSILVGFGRTSGNFTTERGYSGTFANTEFLVGVRLDTASVTGYADNLAVFSGFADSISSGWGIRGSSVSDDLTVSYDSSRNVIGGSTSIAGVGIPIVATGGFGRTNVSVTGCPRN